MVKIAYIILFSGVNLWDQRVNGFVNGPPTTVRSHVPLTPIFPSKPSSIYPSSSRPSLSFRVSLSLLEAVSGGGNEIPTLQAEVVKDSTPPAKSDLMQRSYRNTRLIYMGLMFDSIVKSRTLPTVVGPLFPCGANLAIGNALAAAAAHILVGAAEKDRLRSDTYQRLNIGTMAYSAISIWGFMMAWPFSGPAGAFCHVYSLLVCLNGWRTGVAGIRKTKTFTGEIVSGTISAAKRLVDLKEGGLVSTGYALATGFLGIMALHEAAILLLKPINSSVLSRKYIGLGRLVLGTSMSFILKHASDQGRLGRTTFIQLNGAMALSAMSFAGSMIAPMFICQANVASRVLKLAGLFAVSGFFFGSVGMKNYIEKKKIIDV